MRCCSVYGLRRSLRFTRDASTLSLGTGFQSQRANDRYKDNLDGQLTTSDETYTIHLFVSLAVELFF